MGFRALSSALSIVVDPGPNPPGLLPDPPAEFTYDFDVDFSVGPALIESSLILQFDTPNIVTSQGIDTGLVGATVQLINPDTLAVYEPTISPVSEILQVRAGVGNFLPRYASFFFNIDGVTIPARRLTVHTRVVKEFTTAAEGFVYLASLMTIITKGT